jgi:hypothetical protein
MVRSVAWLLVALALPCADAQEYFRFQSNFWVNLHHFVRAEARRRMVGQVPLLPGLPASALEAYSEAAKESLIFDGRLIRINNVLSAVSGDTLPKGLVELQIEAALKAAAPVYRAALWERHRHDNEAWIDSHAPLIRQHAAAMIRALTATYHVTWPDGPILVDLASETGPNEAYTTGGPSGTAGHTVIAPLKTADPDMAFELIFHEASHTVDDQIMKRLEREGKPPRDLWHALIFFTAGTLAQRELGQADDPAYQPYAYRYHLYDKGDWPPLRTALERDWRPYLEGKVAFDDAVRALVRDAAK